ncbi:MAG: amylo-alpha-1,6-glucosidase [Planctomycetota bacterium]
MRPTETELKVSEVLHVWGGGQLIAFSAIDGVTDYERGLIARTLNEGVGVEVVLPGRCELRFGLAASEVLLGGDFFEITTESGMVRGAMLNAHHLLIEGPCDVGEVGDELAVEQEDGRTLIAAGTVLDSALLHADLVAAIEQRQAWLRSQILPSYIEGDSRATTFKALSQMKTQVCSPEGLFQHRWTTPDRWPHRKCWLWDSAFHAIGFRHVDPSLAREMISGYLDAQREDGFCPHMASPAGGSSITQPPVLALAAMLLDQADPNEEWLREVYPKLCAYVRWDLSNRDAADGLLGWNTNDKANNRCDESGMDNSTRFEFDRQLVAVDFNALMALECEILGHLAHALDFRQDAAEWVERYLWRVDAINERMWDEDAGLYMDCFADDLQRTGVLASAGFLPLVCGAASPTQARRLAEHLENPETFGAPVIVPSIAVSDREHYSKDMWRGPMWVNINWLIAFGFRRSGLEEVARRVEQATCREIEKRYLECGSIYEFYDDRGEAPPASLPRKGTNDPQRAYHQVIHDYGWSGTLYLDMVWERR